VALAMNNNQQNQSISDSLRQQKTTESAKQANSQRLASQGVGSNSGVNERLMSRQSPAGSEQSPAVTSQNNENSATEDRSDLLKQAQVAAKLAANPTVAGAAAVAGEMALDAIKKGEGGKMATGQLLKTWWLNLLSSTGITLIPLNLQAWAGFIEGHKFFCKLGEEWKAPGIFKKAIGSLETSGLLGTDLVVFLLLLTAGAFMMFIVNVMTHPLENMQIIWNLFGGHLDNML
jgi:hypothetical protein